VEAIVSMGLAKVRVKVVDGGRTGLPLGGYGVGAEGVLSGGAIQPWTVSSRIAGS
jgi:hypothetical protein